MTNHDDNHDLACRNKTIEMDFWEVFFCDVGIAFCQLRNHVLNSFPRAIVKLIPHARIVIISTSFPGS